jgi:hypothetical protein
VALIRRIRLAIWPPICQWFYDEALSSGDEGCIKFWQRRIEATGRWEKTDE